MYLIEIPKKKHSKHVQRKNTNKIQPVRYPKKKKTTVNLHDKKILKKKQTQKQKPNLSFCPICQIPVTFSIYVIEVRTRRFGG